MRSWRNTVMQCLLITGSLLLLQQCRSLPATPDTTESAIRELVRRGAVVKRFEVRETETAGLLVRLKANHLDSKGMIDPEMLTSLRRIEDLSVELRGLPLSDEGLKSLLANVPLLGLDVSASKVSDRGLQSLAIARRRLRLLDISFTDVSDEGLKSIISQKELRHLSLIETRITSSGLDSLRKLVELRELYLAKTAVTADAIRRLQAEFPECRITH